MANVSTEQWLIDAETMVADDDQPWDGNLLSIALSVTSQDDQYLTRRAALCAAAQQRIARYRLRDRHELLLGDPALGVTVRNPAHEWVIYSKVVDRRLITSDDPPLFGSHLLGYEGTAGVLVLGRGATTEEITVAETAERERERELRLERYSVAFHLHASIQEEGECPQGMTELPGQPLMGGYTDGTRHAAWVVTSPETGDVWAVTYHHDGLPYGRPNVISGGVVAYGWRAPLTPRISALASALHDAGVRL